MQKIISSKTNLETYVNEQMSNDWAFNPDDTETMVDVILGLEHPRYGTDWTDFLDLIDLGKIRVLPDEPAKLSSMTLDDYSSRLSSMLTDHYGPNFELPEWFGRDAEVYFMRRTSLSKAFRELIVSIDTAQVEEALGGYLCTASNPTGAAVYFDEIYYKPWRIADDHTEERYEDLEKAIAGAKDWQKRMID